MSGKDITTDSYNAHQENSPLSVKQMLSSTPVSNFLDVGLLAKSFPKLELRDLFALVVTFNLSSRNMGTSPEQYIEQLKSVYPIADSILSGKQEQLETSEGALDAGIESKKTKP